jgi:hypothetical protein
MTVCEDLERKSVLDDILVLRVSDSWQSVEPRCDTRRYDVIAFYILGMLQMHATLAFWTM